MPAKKPATKPATKPKKKPKKKPSQIAIGGGRVPTNGKPIKIKVG